MTGRAIAALLICACSFAASGCLGPSGGCWGSGGFLGPDNRVTERLLSVDTFGNESLEAALAQSSFQLTMEFVGSGAPFVANLSYNASGRHGAGFYSNDFFRDFGRGATLGDTREGTHPFRIKLDIGTTDPWVRSWVFFGGDNVGEGNLTLSNSGDAFSVESLDFDISTGGGTFTIAQNMRATIGQVNTVCA